MRTGKTAGRLCVAAFTLLWVTAPLAQAQLAQAEHYGPPEQQVGPLPFYGVHGLAVTPDGRLLAGSVVGQSLSQVDRKTGHVKQLIGAPEGMTDDIAIGPDGMLAWTSFLEGTLHARGKDGEIRTLAENLPGINSLAFSENGRLFASQVFLGDALYEIDPSGQKPPRKIATDLGGFNGFEVGSDGWIYGPLWFRGKVVRIDPDSGDVKTVADGFKTPAAVNFGADGQLYVVDTATGGLVRVDPDSGDKTRVAQLKPSLDNLAIAGDGTIYVSNMADDSIQSVDPATGAVSTITRSRLAAPSGLAAVGDTLYIADIFAYRRMDTTTGQIRTLKRMFASDIGYPGGAWANDDTVILASATTNTVQILDRRTATTRAILKGFQAPVNALQLDDGRMLITELGSGSLLTVDAAHPQQRTTVLGDIKGPLGLALAPDEKTVYLSTLAGEIWAVDTGDWSKRSIATGLEQPEGIALTPGGRLVVMEVGASRILQIDPKSGARALVAGGIDMDLPPLESNPVGLFNGVTVNAQGDLYFTTSARDGGLYRIRRE